MEDCLLNSSCNGLRLIGPAQGLHFRRCEFFGPGRFEHRTPVNHQRTNMLAAILLQPSAWTPTPGPLEDVTFDDITIRNVACALHLCIREGNTADRLTFERIRASGVYSAAVSLESWADEAIGRDAVRHCAIAYDPDRVIDPRLGRAPTVQDPIRKPGVGVWNRKLPVWGLYARRVEHLTVEDVMLKSTDEQEKRPVIRMDRVDHRALDSLRHAP